MTIEKSDIHNLFYKPTSEMTNQELNMLVSLNNDARSEEHTLNSSH